MVRGFRLYLLVRLCVLWLLAGCAYAGNMPNAPRSPVPDINQRYGQVVNQLFAFSEQQQRRQKQVGFDVYELPPMLLAEVDSQLRRQDLRTAIGNANGSIAVIYPDIGEPYRSIFFKIIEGIEEMARSRVVSYPIGGGADASDLNATLKRNGTRVVIALGRQGLKATNGLDRDISVVVGGVLSVPENDNHNLVGGISLTPDPALLFSRLRSLQPGVRRVFVVYDPQQNDWLMRLAREAARNQGLELVAQPAQSTATAARIYESLLSNADGRRDALWLPQDSTTVDDNSLLPLILRETWTRNMAVFSSSFLHVKKGVLFALYPNNVEIGRSLASSALGLLNGEPRSRGLLPLREVLMAVNLRTASHMGLTISYQQQRSFDFVFPEP